jgi:hypothetical protein
VILESEDGMVNLGSQMEPRGVFAIQGYQVPAEDHVVADVSEMTRSGQPFGIIDPHGDLVPNVAAERSKPRKKSKLKI